VSEAGGPGDFELKTWVAAFAPKGTSVDVVRRLNGDIAAALATPAARERFRTFGFEPWAGDPATVARAQEQDWARFADIVKQANLSLD